MLYITGTLYSGKILNSGTTSKSYGGKCFLCFPGAFQAPKTAQPEVLRALLPLWAHLVNQEGSEELL